MLTDLLANLQSTLSLSTEGGLAVDHGVASLNIASSPAAHDAHPPVPVNNVADHGDSGHVLAAGPVASVVSSRATSASKAVVPRGAESPEHLYPAGRVLWIMPDVANHPADESSVQVLCLRVTRLYITLSSMSLSLVIVT